MLEVKYYLEPSNLGDAIFEEASPIFEPSVKNIIIRIGDLYRGRYEVFSPYTGHSMADAGYLTETCQEITLDQYLEWSKGWHTPFDYLQN